MASPKLWTCDGCGKRAPWDRATWRWWPGVEAPTNVNAANVKPGRIVPAVACSEACESIALERCMNIEEPDHG